MGKKFVTVDESNIIQEVFDEDNKNVPDGALSITDIEFSMFNDPIYSFADFRMTNGALLLRPEATDNIKDRIVDSFTPEMFDTFMEMLTDELNILRTANGLPNKTIAQRKIEMKNKLP